ncbi:MAG: aminotransferase class I/II-fold pyridoxal phosphate-dependent enzyme [Candidatus Omnitrophica bacterium]|nr:aminotransferase class I/II-fold pyridoxal phosphate-dependent enzyme [Candidatus Omnitrophota bacterium]MBD3268782.1 aminotransferase class I/II-fold pyridoxal phosphate-dependent enzyme [Candidatus Omnitrophota bacterium]
MVNSRVTALNKSATLKITALTKKLKREGKDVVNFAAGEPDFDTPDFIKNAAKDAIDKGFTKYTPSAGIPSLREAIAEKLRNKNKLKVEAEDILVTTGAKYAIFTAILTLTAVGDEVLIPSPYWVSYPEIVKLAGGEPVFLETRESSNFKVLPRDLDAACSERTKVLILNYPNNPTGSTYSEEELSAISEVAEKHNLFVVSDEIYEALVYDGKRHVSIASLPGMAERTLTVNGFSKAFSMTGWRIGYLAGKKDVIKEASKIIDHTTSCSCAISQKGALAALSSPDWQEKVKNDFQLRRNEMFDNLTKCKFLTPFKSEGTFYMFCDIRKTNLNSFEFSSRLLENHLVSCIPADAFGLDGFVRLSFSTGLEQIIKGVDRIKDFESRL